MPSRVMPVRTAANFCHVAIFNKGRLVKEKDRGLAMRLAIDLPFNILLNFLVICLLRQWGFKVQILNNTPGFIHRLQLFGGVAVASFPKIACFPCQAVAPTA